MPWTEIRSKSKNERSFVRHKGRKPADTPYLHMTEDGKLRISNSSSTKGEDRDAERDSNPTQSKDAGPSMQLPAEDEQAV